MKRRSCRRRSPARPAKAPLAGCAGALASLHQCVPAMGTGCLTSARASRRTLAEVAGPSLVYMGRISVSPVGAKSPVWRAPSWPRTGSVSFVAMPAPVTGRAPESPRGSQSSGIHRTPDPVASTSCADHLAGANADLISSWRSGAQMALRPRRISYSAES